MNTVNKPFRKKDAMQLVTGQPVYMDDVIPQDCLIVKLLRSPHANAMMSIGQGQKRTIRFGRPVSRSTSPANGGRGPQTNTPASVPL